MIDVIGFPEYLKSLRLSLGLSQDSLSLASGVRIGNITRLEQALMPVTNVAADTVSRLANVLGTTALGLVSCESAAPYDFIDMAYDDILARFDELCAGRSLYLISDEACVPRTTLSSIRNRQNDIRRMSFGVAYRLSLYFRRPVEYIIGLID